MNHSCLKIYTPNQDRIESGIQTALPQVCGVVCCLVLQAPAGRLREPDFEPTRGVAGLDTPPPGRPVSKGGSHLDPPPPPLKQRPVGSPTAGMGRPPRCTQPMARAVALLHVDPNTEQ